jgi:hypothetical protein
MRIGGELGGRVAVSGTFDNTWAHAPASSCRSS